MGIEVGCLVTKYMLARPYPCIHVHEAFMQLILILDTDKMMASQENQVNQLCLNSVASVDPTVLQSLQITVKNDNLSVDYVLF